MSPDGGYPAPVALFVYKRPWHTEQTLRALRGNSLAEKTTLYVFSDGPKNGSGGVEHRRVDEVRDLLRREQWCGEVIVREHGSNLGLANSIRSGVEEVLQRHDRLIVLEDDLVTSPGFLDYMNRALSLYETEPRVMNVSAYLPETSYQGFLPETLFLRNMSCWGWGTWRGAWQKGRWDARVLLDELERHPGGITRFDLDGSCRFSDQLIRNLRGSLESWAIFWAASIYLAGGLSLFPGRSLVRNIGADGTGENFTSDQSLLFGTRLADSIRVSPIPVRESCLGRSYLKSFYRYGRDASLSRRLKIRAGRLKHKIAKVAGRV